MNTRTIKELQADVVYEAGSIAAAAANVEKAKTALDQATMRLAQCNEKHSRAVDALVAAMNERCQAPKAGT